LVEILLVAMGYDIDKLHNKLQKNAPEDSYSKNLRLNGRKNRISLHIKAGFKAGL
jgi:hypothetical protein